MVCFGNWFNNVIDVIDWIRNVGVFGFWIIIKVDSVIFMYGDVF